MPLPNTIRDLNTNPASNSPAGTENRNTADDYFRYQAAIIRQGDSEGSIASASTCDLGTIGARHIAVTGTTGITSFGATAAAGEWKILRFAGALTITHNASSLVCVGNANITTAANDCAIVRCLGSGNWTMVIYTRISGMPVLTGTSAQFVRGEGSYSNELIAAAGQHGLRVNSSASQKSTVSFFQSGVREWQTGCTGAASYVIADVSGGRDPLLITTNGNWTLAAPSNGTTQTVNAASGQVAIDAAGAEARVRLSASSGRTFELVSGGGSLISANLFGVYDITGGALRYSISSAGAHTFAAPGSGSTVVTINTPAPSTASDRAVQINGSNVGDVRLGIQSATTGNAQLHLDTAGVQNWSISNVRSDGSWRLTNSQTPGTNDRYTISTAGTHSFTGSVVVTAGLTVSASGAAITGNTSVSGGTFTTRGFADNATAAAWSLDSSGRLINNGNTQPRFYAYSSATRTTNGTFITYTESSDIGAAFDPSTGLYTCPVSGTYLFTAIASATSSAVNTGVELSINCSSAPNGLGFLALSIDTEIGSGAQVLRNLSSGPVYLTSGAVVGVGIVVSTGSVSTSRCNVFNASLLS